MRVTRSLKSLHAQYCAKCNPDMKVTKTADDLWKESAGGKSIHSTGVSRDKVKQLNRMRADQLDNVADRFANMAVYAMMNYNGEDAKMFGERAEAARKQSAYHRRISELL